MTIHDFDMARYVTGSEVVEVYAAGAVRVDPAIGAIGDIDTAVVVLRHASGCLTVIDNSRQAVYGYDQRVEAFGAGGVAASDPLPTGSCTRVTGRRATAADRQVLRRSLRADLPAPVGGVRRRRRRRAGRRR